MKYIIRFSTLFIFWSDWIRSVQNGSKWINQSNSIKLYFWWNNHWNISSELQFYWSDLIRSVKMDQNGSNWISDEITIEIFHRIFKFIYLFLDQNGSDLSKMDQTWSNWISDEIIIEIYHQIFNLIYLLIRLNQICPKLWI